MEQIKRNSSEFKKVKGIVEDYVDKPTRKKLILLYSIKPAEDLSSRVLLNKNKNASVFYDLTYQSLMDHLNNPRKKLFREGKKALYYFKSSAASGFIELPFELTGKLKKELFPLRIL